MAADLGVGSGRGAIQQPGSIINQPYVSVGSAGNQNQNSIVVQGSKRKSTSIKSNDVSSSIQVGLQQL